MVPGLEILIETVPVGLLETNCYLVADPRSLRAVIIDPGGEGERIERSIAERGWQPVAIVNTHGHADHVGADLSLKERFHIPVCIHRLDAPFLSDPLSNGSALLGGRLVLPAADVLLDEGSIVEAGGLKLIVRHTPGHTPGGICLHTDGHLFTGDTLFRDDVGRTDLVGGDEETLVRSLEKIRILPSSTRIYPGHGPSSMLRHELDFNPYFRSGRTG